MTSEDIKFFLHGKAVYGDPESFKQTWLYKYFTELYGEMVYLAGSDMEFIKVTLSGMYYDEIYTIDESGEPKLGTFIPVSFIGKKKSVNGQLWKDVARKGYGVLEYPVHPNIKNRIYEIPFKSSNEQDPSVQIQANEELTYHAYDLAKYTNVASNPPCFSRNIEVDALKYSYAKYKECTKGPYQFHMDFIPGLYYMFFSYHTKAQSLKGRELFVSKRKKLNITDLDKKTLSKGGEAYDHQLIRVKNNMVVFINSYNPLFVHRVMPMRSQDELILFTNYVHI
jgi:hypothetical protein